MYNDYFNILVLTPFLVIQYFDEGGTVRLDHVSRKKCKHLSNTIIHLSTLHPYRIVTGCVSQLDSPLQSTMKDAALNISGSTQLISI
jgi:hypothetical protein